MIPVKKPAPVFIAAAAYAKRHECIALMRDPGFRKATTPMMMAWQALEKALTQLVPDVSLLSTKTWGLVFGTSHGELEVTKDFLVTFATKGLARPILFQNSLHHSTLGFISLRLGISGPGMTVSNHFFSGEDAISSAMDLIRSGSCNIAVTVAVDALVPGLEGALGQYYPDGLVKDEGAGCLVLASAKGLEQLGTTAIAAISDITYNYRTRSKNKVAVCMNQRIEVFSDYDSDAVEKISRYLQETVKREPLQLNKPDGTSACIDWAEHSEPQVEK